VQKSLGSGLAFTEAGVPEDLFVAHTGGTQYRRLTDDAFRDRGPAWAPDGTRITFYSDRSRRVRSVDDPA